MCKQPLLSSNLKCEFIYIKTEVIGGWNLATENLSLLLNFLVTLSLLSKVLGSKM